MIPETRLIKAMLPKHYSTTQHQYSNIQLKQYNSPHTFQYGSSSEDILASPNLKRNTIVIYLAYISPRISQYHMLASTLSLQHHILSGIAGCVIYMFLI